MNEKLLVFGPGFADPSLVIDQLAKRFDKGFDKIVLSYVDRGTRRPIEDTAKDLFAPLLILRKSYKFIVFIGHSMGGLIGRELMDLAYPERLFDAYVSIGTPHHGTRLAALAPHWLFKTLSPATLAMAPGSTFLARIDKNTDYFFNPDSPGFVPSLTIAAGFDELVWPASSAQIDGIDNHVKIPWTSHVSVALSERTYLEIWAYIIYEILGEKSPGEDSGFHQKLKGPPA